MTMARSDNSNMDSIPSERRVALGSNAIHKKKHCAVLCTCMQEFLDFNLNRLRVNSFPRSLQANDGLLLSREGL